MGGCDTFVNGGCLCGSYGADCAKFRGIGGAICDNGQHNDGTKGGSLIAGLAVVVVLTSAVACVAFCHVCSWGYTTILVVVLCSS